MLSYLVCRVVLILVTIPLTLGAAGWTVGEQVDTTSGTVTGHGSNLFPEVSEYLGIPYAAPPVGELRWAIPQSFKKSDKVLVASSYGPDCPGVGAVKKANGSSNPLAAVGGGLAATFAQTGHKYSEDCLTVNIWTKRQIGEKKKAVLVS